MPVHTPEWRHTLRMPNASGWTCIETGRSASKLFQLHRVRLVIADLEKVEYREERGPELTLKAVVRNELELSRLLLAVEPDAAQVVRQAWGWQLGRRLEVVVAAQRIAANWGLTLHDQLAESGRAA